MTHAMTWAGCGVVLEVPGDSISMSGGSDVGSRVTDVGKLAGRVTARGDIPAEDLLLGMDQNGRVVVRIKQLVQCARNVGERAASMVMKEQGAAAELAHLLGHGDSLNTASWGHHKHPVQAEADRVSHALTGVKLDLERQGRTCKTLEADVKDLRVQLLAAQEAQRVTEEVSRFLATTAEVQLQQPEITGLAVPVAFTLHVPVQRDGECEYEHYGGVLQEEATKETSMLALEMLLKEVFFRDASENLARALGIAGGVFDTARWPDAVIAQAT